MSAVLRFADVRASVHGDLEGGPWSLAVGRGALAAVQAPPSVADTIVRLCIGTAEPVSGVVEVLGERPASLERFRRHALLRRMGVSFQREGLVSNLSLEDNLVVPLVYGGTCTVAEARTRAAGAMRELGLDPYRGGRPAALPRETRILAALARAALRNPELLILEHLTAGLPDAAAANALTWCRSRCETMLVVVPAPSAPLDRMSVAWLPPLKGPREEGPPA